MTQEQSAKLLTTIGKVAAGAGAMAGGPTGAAIAVALGIIAPLVETLAIVARGEEPTDEQLAHADRLCIASNAAMNDAVDDRLRQLGQS